jgi:hypothetical protein
MFFLLLASLTTAFAEDQQTMLTWDLAVQGKPVGTRTVTIKYVSDGVATRRIMESFTDVNGQVGPIRARYRQRMTAHIAPGEPASFHSVVEENGKLMEIQGRWTPSAWAVTTTVDRKSRSTDLPLTRVDLSTADLMDPYTRVGLDGRKEARILSAETGDVQMGTVEPLGVEELKITGTPVQVTGWRWTGPQGVNTFWYSADGFLVKYQTQLLGIVLDAVLHDPPPGGVDDFPVAAGNGRSIEVLDL